MITSDRQYVPRTPITRLVKNKEYQSFQPIIWPEKSVSHVSRRMENRAGGGILSNDNDSCAPVQYLSHVTNAHFRFSEVSYHFR